MRFELVSPERRLASVDDAKAVRIPGADGDMTAMADHAPTITSLRPGILTVETPSGEQSFVVTGGFAEIGSGVTVLAERAVPVADITQSTFSDWVAEAHKSHAEAPVELIDSAAKLLADMVAIGGHIGLDANQSNL